MAMDPRIALAGVQPEFGLRGLMQGLQAGQQFRGNQMTLAEQGRQQAEEDALRGAFANRAAGLAGLAPQMGGGSAPDAVQERQLGGTPSAMAPYAQPPPGGPQAPQGLAGLGPQMQPGGGGAPGAPPMPERAFLDQLYSISPKGAMAYEKHLADQQRAAGEAQEAQMKGNVARVEFLGRVADGVLESGEPQKAWEVGRAMLIEQGMPPDQVPTVYDPSFVQQLSGMARDAKDRYNAGMLSLQQAKEQRERTQLAAKVPDYGLGQDGNRLMFQRYGAQIPPGQAPTPAMTQEISQALVAEKGQATAQAQAETARHHRALEAAQGTAAERGLTQQQAERENQLRDEYNTLSKDYRTQSDAYGRVQVSAQDPSAAGDLSMIFSYMKLLDPGSVVREGEQATAANARGVDESVRSYYNRVLTGERLAPEQRKDFVDRAQRLYDQATQDNQRIRTQYEERATRYGVDPKNVTTDFGSTARQTLSEADIAATIADSQKPGNTPLTRQQVLEWGRQHNYQVPGQ